MSYVIVLNRTVSRGIVDTLKEILRVQKHLYAEGEFDADVDITRYNLVSHQHRVCVFQRISN